MAFVLGALVVLLVLGFVIWPLVRPPVVATQDDPVELSPAEQRAAIYRELIDLELDLRLGKIDETDYRALADALMARAAALIGEEDATRESLDEQVEREIAAEREVLRNAVGSRTEEVPQ